MLWQIILSWTSIAAIVITGFTVIYANRRPVFLYYSLFSCALALWLGCQFFVDNMISSSLWMGLGFLSIEAAAGFFVLFVYSFPDGPAFPRKYLPLPFLGLITLGPLSFSSLMVQVTADGDFKYGVMYVFQTVVLLITVIAAMGILVFRHINIKKGKHGQLPLLLIAFVPFLVASYLTGVTFVNNDNLQFLRPLSAFIMTLIIIYAIVRRKLFDIRTFVLRAVSYTMSVILLTIVYIAPMLFVLIYVLGVRQISTPKLLVILVIGTLAATSFSRVQGAFNKLTSKFFFRDSYNPTQLLAELNQALVGTIDVHKVGVYSSDIITKYLEPEFCFFVLKKDEGYRVIGNKNNDYDEKSINSVTQVTEGAHKNIIRVDLLPDGTATKESLVNNEIAVIVQLTPKGGRKHDVLGSIALGTRKSGKLYDKTDLQVLDALSNILIIAIQNALHFEEIQRFNITLQSKVDDATRQLRRTNQKLEALDETKDDFISMASHQLRTPLTSVKGYLSMVLDEDAGKVNETQRKMLNQAFVSSQRMVYLIADLLNVSRLKTGKFVIDWAPVDLSKVIQEEISQLMETAEARGVKLTYKKPADFPTVKLDETKTRQVIMNFIDNAIYYTPAGGHIDVQLEDHIVSIELKVVDDGIGVPKTEQHHLFTKFYRARNAQKARPDGTGLGLFMAKKVIVSQGGSVLFESKENMGSTFGFNFPKIALERLSAAQPVSDETIHTTLHK